MLAYGRLLSHNGRGRQSVQPIYDRSGRVVAWLSDSDIYNLRGRHSAVLHGGQDVHGHRGQHLGVLDSGLFRDHRGRVVAFLKGARGGPVLPVAQVAPVRPVRSVRPVRAVRAVPPVRAVRSLSWGESWSQFISK